MLNGPAIDLVQWLQADGPLLLSEMAARLGEVPGYDADSALNDCVALVAILDKASMIEVSGADSVLIGLRDAWRTRGASLFSLDSLQLARGGRRRRYPPNSLGIARAVVRSQGVVAVAGLVVCLVLGVVVGLVYGAIDFANRQTAEALVIGPAVMGLAHLGILFVHEWGHLVAARLAGLKPAYAFSEGRKIGIVRSRGGRVALALVSMAGPISAAAVALLLVAAIQAVSPGYWVTSPSGMASSCLLLYCVGHLLSLLPFAGDGRNVLRAIVGGRGVRRHEN
ncbi:MAG: hypothetical protein LBE08_08360 [Bifidobacteriaceae bacterium]|nr:hypothetical protein [Bifidobacteriaceae bacterium]